MGPKELKQHLLTFAKDGGIRTSLPKNWKLRLRGYMNFRGQCYDINFCRELMQIAPQWFKNHTETDPGVLARKEQMIQAAASGMTRKEYIKQYGAIGFRYTTKSKSYDPVFTEKMQAIAPTWFPKLRVTKNKQLLIAYAKSGAKLPGQNTFIRATLNNYTRTEYPCFDPAFRKQIQQIRPEWFGA